MERRAPLARTTALPRGRGPARKTPLPRAVPGQRESAEARSGRTARPRKQIDRDRIGNPDKEPARKPAPRATGPSAATRELVAGRDNGMCVRCGALATNVHHREGRGMGGRKGADAERVNSPAYLLSLCGSGTTGCHGWVTEHPKRARDDGYVLRRNAPAAAEQTPVFTADGWQRFTTDGYRTPCPPPPAPERT